MDREGDVERNGEGRKREGEREGIGRETRG